MKRLIDKNDYIKNCYSNNKKNVNSLSYLISNKLSQSDCIKLGIGLERILSDFILSKNKKMKNIKPKNKKGLKERDHLFRDRKNKIIYYAELKSNLNLDSEKCKSTIDKCNSIYNELQKEYPKYLIKMFLVGNRYLEKINIPKFIRNKYIKLKKI